MPETKIRYIKERKDLEGLSENAPIEVHAIARAKYKETPVVHRGLFAGETAWGFISREKITSIKNPIGRFVYVFDGDKIILDNIEPLLIKNSEKSKKYLGFLDKYFS